MGKYRVNENFANAEKALSTRREWLPCMLLLGEEFKTRKKCFEKARSSAFRD